ncbi:MAG: NBR1-Ig-like domain-containing protein [Anaerolineales bacterium]
MRTLMKVKLPLLLAAMLIFVSACGASATPNAEATFNPMITAAAQTMEALLTQAANQGQATATSSSGSQSLPSATPVPTYTLMPTFTPFVVTQAPTSTTFVVTPIVPTSTAVTKCDWIQFVSDVTVPDGTTYTPGATFVKTWRLKNIGTCTWTTSYSLVYVTGDQMGGAASVPLASSVAPGATVDVSVTLTAPTAEKTYTGYWMLKNASGSTFGYGANAKSTFYVKINVYDPTVSGIIYNFADNMCDAAWTSGAGAITCPSASGADGFVDLLTAPKFENNTTGSSRAILAHPESVNDGYITGKFPAFEVMDGDHFKADVGCQYGSTLCFVHYQLDYKEVGDPAIYNLWEWDEKYDNKIAPVDVDLSSLKGKNVRFFLRVESLGDPTQDDAIWYAPRIIRKVPISASKACQIVSQTPANNSTLAASADWDAVFKIKNISSSTWDDSVLDVVYQGGADMHKYADLFDLPSSVAKGDTITLTIDMLAPADNGTYSEIWSIMDGSTAVCSFAVTIKVPAP